MSEIRHVYRIGAPTTEQINAQLGAIGQRLDQMEGFRGTPEFQADVNLKGNKATNAGSAIADTDLMRQGDSVTREEFDATVEELRSLIAASTASDGLDHLPFVTQGASRAWMEVPCRLELTGTGNPAGVAMAVTPALYGYSFTKEAVAANEKRMQIVGLVPYGVIVSPTAQVFVHDFNDTVVGGANGMVYWSLQYAWLNIGEAVDPATPVTTVTSLQTLHAATAQYMHFTTPFSIAGPTKKRSSLLIGTLRRLSADAQDDYPNGVIVPAVSLRVQVASVGELAAYDGTNIYET